MLKPLHNTVEGWLNWQVIGPDGRIQQEGEQHNLITDHGLNTMSGTGFLGAMAHAVIGTGSAPPAVSDTALSFAVAFSNDNGGIPTTTTRLSNGRYRFVQVREFIETNGSGNFTEWGFAVVPNSGVTVRELFRDGQGNPVVISKDSNQKLRLIYTLDVTLSPVTRTPGAFSIAGLGTLTGSYLLHLTIDAFALGDLVSVEQAMKGVGEGEYGFRLAPLFDPGIRNLTYDTYIGLNDVQKAVGTVPPYVAGSFTRGGASYTFNTDQANGLITGFGLVVMNASQARAGYTFALDAGQEINKTNLDRLTIVGPSVSWGRA